MANSNFNCQWGKKEEGRQRVGWDVIFMGSVQMNGGEREGLGMKAYSLSQLKSALT